MIQMKEKQIKKKSGGFRYIVCPNRKEKKFLRKLLDELQPQVTFPSCVQGFIPGRNIVTNAKQHLDYDVTISFDLKDFFDTCFQKDPPEYYTQYQEKIKKISRKWTAQGLPTSPLFCNILAEQIDKKLVLFFSKIKLMTAYTRYADDLSISFNLLGQTDIIKYVIQHITKKIETAGFKINTKKTRVQYATAGRREICGVMVEDAVHISRKQRRKLRAAKHNYLVNQTKQNKYNFQGLLEFSKLKEPNTIQANINKDIHKIRKNIFILKKYNHINKARIVSEQRELLNRLSCYMSLKKSYKNLYYKATAMLLKEVSYESVKYY